MEINVIDKSIEQIEKEDYEEGKLSRPDWIGTDLEVRLDLSQNEHWINFKSKLQNGDKIAWYDDISFLSGSAGYCIIREDKPVEFHSKWIS